MNESSMTRRFRSEWAMMERNDTRSSAHRTQSEVATTEAARGCM